MDVRTRWVRGGRDGGRVELEAEVSGSGDTEVLLSLDRFDLGSLAAWAPSLRDHLQLSVRATGDLELRMAHDKPHRLDSDVRVWGLKLPLARAGRSPLVLTSDSASARAALLLTERRLELWSGHLQSGDLRLGLDVRLLLADARAPAIRGARTVLLDAPCTGTGVLRRRPDARWRLGQDKLDSLVALQRELLDAMADLVEPGGLLVYATCSLEAEENEEQVKCFLVRHGDFRREPPEPTWVPDGATDENGDLRVLPWKWDTDGAFASRLRRS